MVSQRQIFRLPDIPARLGGCHWPRPETEAGGFLLAHAIGGVAGLFAAIAWAGFGAPVSPFEWLVLVWLASPLALAAMALWRLPMGVLQAGSAVNTILMLSGLAALSGGLGSIFMPWLVLVPAEAALTRRPLTLVAAIAAGIAALAALFIFDPSLPAMAMPHALASALMMASLIGCLCYAGMLALNVRAVHAKAARKAAESEASYRFLADNAADLILRLSASGEVLYASSASESLLHVAPGDMVGHMIGELIHDSDLAATQRALVRAGYFGEEAVIECRARDGSGAQVWIELKCRPVHKPDTQRRRPWWQLVGRRAKAMSRGMEIIAIARDVTLRHRHEEELMRAIALAEAQSHAKSRFLANMSHELRTPLNSILGFSEMISREMFGPLGHPRYHEYAGLIGESGQYLLNLINDILDVAKIEAGKYALSPVPLNLAQTLERTLLVMMPQFRDKCVSLAVDVAPDLPMIEADARAVRQMLFNLLSNALKFTPAKGSTRVRLVRGEDFVLIEVGDSGIGISKADLKRLAKPFEQASHSYARAQTGTGLGLALVKSLAALHGGSLGIESELGKGTRVSVRLPIKHSGAPHGASEIAAAA